MFVFGVRKDSLSKVTSKKITKKSYIFKRKDILNKKGWLIMYTYQKQCFLLYIHCIIYLSSGISN